MCTYRGLHIRANDRTRHTSYCQRPKAHISPIRSSTALPESLSHPHAPVPPTHLEQRHQRGQRPERQRLARSSLRGNRRVHGLQQGSYRQAGGWSNAGRRSSVNGGQLVITRAQQAVTGTTSLARQEATTQLVAGSLRPCQQLWHAPSAATWGNGTGGYLVREGMHSANVPVTRALPVRGARQRGT
jgi:hypothetical protein